MPYFLISVLNDEHARTRTPEEMAPMFAAVDAAQQRAKDEGMFVFSGGLEELSDTTTINGSTGTPVSSDGPYVETKEYLGGFSILDAPDRETAVVWAQECAVACRAVVEVRPFMEGSTETA